MKKKVNQKWMKNEQITTKWFCTHPWIEKL